MIFGKSEWKIIDSETTISLTLDDYTITDSDINELDVIEKKYKSGRKDKKIEGYYHSFEYEIYTISDELLRQLYSIENKEITFQPHVDNENWKFKASITLKPVSNNELGLLDSIQMTVESTEYNKAISKYHSSSTESHSSSTE